VKFMELPTVVRLRKTTRRGEQQKSLDGLCDVYIGPRICNPSWDLPDSIWTNPYHTSLIPDTKSRLLAYRRRLMRMLRNEPSFRNQLRSLAGKRLGCFCDNPASCHGSVLVDLVRTELGRDAAKQLVQNYHLLVPETSGGGAFYFRGPLSPLSGLYPCDLHFDGKRFSCLEQLRQYRLAKKGEVEFLIPTIMKAQDYRALRKVAEFVHEQIYYNWDYSTKGSCQILSSFVWKIQELLELMRIKWEQCAAFRELCTSNHECAFIEATSSKFFGCGRSLEEISTDTKLTELPGCNHVGWIIKRVLYENLFGATHGLALLQTLHKKLLDENSPPSPQPIREQIPIIIRGLENVITCDSAQTDFPVL